MQLISETSQKQTVGAAAAFEILGAVNSAFTLARIKGHIVSCMREA